ncbi:SgcJ/EcaC family oxidoreductase [Muricauda sp. JGD-17]|uniref:SgcJ/EcaC family oxidoreductase n=1 Tax=Flagellimonas ochracea TaxID=2696472 RepID=A0A964TEI9_9FLAO|nr:SgcJ/EcaC family oxidoreductase [Allomuricauda ochracea]NAY93362.1 SgcJ/EcaC family oxidoreductase [Allomuricauda ochracea]
MKKIVFLLCIVGSTLACSSKKTEHVKNYDSDKEKINRTIAEWDKAWETKDLELAIAHYADKTDWTNAFGDRTQSKQELEELLDFIFGLDFVMTGENDYGTNDITFLNDSIATVRSTNIRKNQEWPDGSKMEDRHINHLRVYKKIEEDWFITNHMISQAWPKRQVTDSIAN